MSANPSTSYNNLNKYQQIKEAASVELAPIKSIISKSKFIGLDCVSAEDTIETCLKELSSAREISSIIQALKFSSYVTVCFDFTKNDLTSIASSDALGWYNDEEKELLIGTKDVFANKHKFLGVFAHELAHWCLELVFKNNGNPYYQSDPKRLKAHEFENIVEAVRTDVQNNPNAFHTVIQACFYSGYLQSEWGRELIVRVPHVIAECGTARTEEILSRHESTKSLLTFYRSHVMDEVDKFIAEGDLEGSRETIYRLNRKFGLLERYVEHELQFCNSEDIEMHESDSILVYSSRHPFTTFLKIAHTLNCYEPNNKFYANNLFCTFQVFVENFEIINRQFFKREWCNTIFVLCPGVESGHLGRYDDCLKDLLELATNSNKRVVLVIECKLVTPTKTQLMKTQNGRLIDLTTREMDIRDLVETSQQRILQHPITFLGKQVQLQEIMSSDELNLVDGNLIDRVLLNEEQITVGSEANRVDVRLPGFVTFYENMSVGRLVDFVGECMARTNFVVIVGKSENYPEVVTRELCKLSEVDSIEELYVSPADKFRSIGETNSLLRGQVLLVASRTDYDYIHIIDLLKNLKSSTCYFINIESEETIYLDLLYAPSLKFDRKLMMKSHQLDNDELDGNSFISELLSGEHRLFVISDEPGSGKSLFLNDIQLVLNHRTNFDGYVMKFALRECSSFIDKYTINPELKLEEAHRFLCALGRIDDDIERKLFGIKIKNTSKSRVILLLDGFDEIGSSDLHSASQNKEKIANLVHCLKQHTSVIIVIATRSESETYLCNLYCTVSKFKILDEEFITSYVLRFCLSRLKLRYNMELSTQTLGKVRAYLKTANILPTPLHITMISELFLEMGRNESPEFYKPDFSKFDFSIMRFRMPSIEKLYHEFINLKYKIYFREKKNSVVDIRTKENCDSVFQRLALFSLYGNEEFAEDFFSNDPIFMLGTAGNVVLNTDKVREYYDIGMISSFSKSSIEFIHRIFAEYYVSKLFISWLHNRMLSKISIVSIAFRAPMDSFVNNICTVDDDRKYMYEFINLMLSSESFSANLLKNHHSTMTSLGVENNVKALSSHLIHGYFNIVNHIVKCWSEVGKFQELLLYCATVQQIDEDSSEQILSKYFSKDFLGDRTDEDLGAFRRCMSGFCVTHKYGIPDYCVLKCQLDLCTELLGDGNVGVLETLLGVMVENKLISSENKVGKLMHLAACGGNQTVVKWMEEMGGDILSKTDEGRTSLDFAGFMQKFEMAEWLYKREMNKKISMGAIKRQASLEDRIEVVSNLLRSVANLNDFPSFSDDIIIGNIQPSLS